MKKHLMLLFLLMVFVSGCGLLGGQSPEQERANTTTLVNVTAVAMRDAELLEDEAVKAKGALDVLRDQAKAEEPDEDVIDTAVADLLSVFHAQIERLVEAGVNVPDALVQATRVLELYVALR